MTKREKGAIIPCEDMRMIINLGGDRLCGDSEEDGEEVLAEVGEWALEGLWVEETRIPSVASIPGYRGAGGEPVCSRTWLLPIITIDPR